MLTSRNRIHQKRNSVEELERLLHSSGCMDSQSCLVTSDTSGPGCSKDQSTNSLTRKCSHYERSNFDTELKGVIS